MREIYRIIRVRMRNLRGPRLFWPHTFWVIFWFCAFAISFILKMFFPYASNEVYLYGSISVMVISFLDILLDFLQYFKNNFLKEYEDKVFTSFLSVIFIAAVLFLWFLMQQGRDFLSLTLSILIVSLWNVFLSFVVIFIGIKKEKIVRKSFQ